jgi:hypothetical protein
MFLSVGTDIRITFSTILFAPEKASSKLLWNSKTEHAFQDIYLRKVFKVRNVMHLKPHQLLLAFALLIITLSGTYKPLLGV